ncbi:YutD family protein [Paenibacillus sp. HB172176]|uniref:YutD family protein n=1 Tax=Paenibacillus sp. HB172176 TaxID=2493690 RepID=UPI001F114032|nr:YutD family protein [Paenibacillus sp. HB172176]
MALIHIGGKSFELIHENRNGWNPEAFRNRYSEVLERYDYIIGDWGYNQLRLKGFFRDGHQKAAKESTFSAVSDYINEYCNFGCAYFILERKQGSRKEFGEGDLDLDDLPPPLPAAEDKELNESQSAVSAASEHDVVDDDAADARIPNSSQGKKRNYFGQRSHHQNQQSGHDKRRRDPFSRKSGRNNDHRSKKPMKLAANEAAAASESPKGNKKEHRDQREQK